MMINYKTTVTTVTSVTPLYKYINIYIYLLFYRSITVTFDISIFDTDVTVVTDIY